MVKMKAPFSTAVLVIILAIGGVVTALWFFGPSSAVVIPLQPGADTTPTNLREIEFDKAYSLKPRENVRVVAPPIAFLRQTWCKSHGIADLPSDGSLLLLWHDAQPASPLEPLLRTPKRLTFRQIIETHLPDFQIDDASGVLDTTVSGDCVIRDGSDAEPFIRDVGRVISETIGHQVQVIPQQSTRDVILVSGSYTFHPLADAVSDAIMVTNSQVSGVRCSTATSPPQSLHSFLMELGSFLSARVIDETHGAVVQVRWMSPQKKPIRDVDRLHRDLELQTSLQFYRSTRPVTVWKFTRS